MASENRLWKSGKQEDASHFSTATTTTNYNKLWDTDSEGKVRISLFQNLKFANPTDMCPASH